MIFGITEAGDASLDYSWKRKLPQIDGAILITKNLTDKFINEVLPERHKVIIHVSCTGYGGTVLEPNLPTYEQQLQQVRKLVNYGFPKEQIVIRIDPIIPTEKGIEKIETIVKEISDLIPRFRVSIIDMYPHVRERFKKRNLPVPFNGEFQASEREFAMVDEKLKELKSRYGVTFECCAEKYLYQAKQTGCVSRQDFDVLNLELEEETLKRQRPTCSCVTAKTELLHRNETSHYGCQYQCLYCYWR